MYTPLFMRSKQESKVILRIKKVETAHFYVTREITKDQMHNEKETYAITLATQFLHSKPHPWKNKG